MGKIIKSQRINELMSREQTYERILRDYIFPFSNSHSLHYSILQPKMQYFEMPDIGIIGYMTFFGGIYVLGDPITEKQNLEILTGEFLRKRGSAAFVQINQPMAELLHTEFGMNATKMGVERVINLEYWNLQGKHKNVIRTAINAAEREGIFVSEGMLEDIVALEEWISTRAVPREMCFLVRPADTGYNQEIRILVARYPNGERVGAIIFDPIFGSKGGERRIIGYIPDISRARVTNNGTKAPLFSPGIWYVLLEEGIRRFRAEGYNIINLGLSPLIFDKDDPIAPWESQSMRHILRSIGEKTYAPTLPSASGKAIGTILNAGFGSLFNYSGVDFPKTRFIDPHNSNDGYERPLYFGHSKNISYALTIQVPSVFICSNILTLKTLPRISKNIVKMFLNKFNL
jgi:lysylphosphatidylglycerol synthetase-like protein (DUF2156 family)